MREQKHRTQPNVVVSPQGTTKEYQNIVQSSIIDNQVMATDFGNPLRKFKLVFLGEQSGKLAYYG